MRACLLALSFLLISSSAARADDGSWSSTYDLAQGPLYSVEGNPDVELSRELLILEDPFAGVVEARFLFRNTSQKQLTVEAGFPIVLDLPFTLAYEHKGGVIKAEATGRPVWLVPFGKYGGSVEPGLLAAAGLPVRRWSPPEEDYELGDRYIRGADFKKQRIERPVPRKPPFRFSVVQDGKPVTLTTLVVETDPNARPSIVFHFRHQLSFAPGQASLVVVRYQAPTLAGAQSGAFAQSLDYAWKYVLRTGASWKGPIGQLVLAVPEGGSCQNERAWTFLGRWAGYRILQRSNFEPGEADDLRCTWKQSDDDASGWDRFWFDDGGAEKTTWEQARRMAPEVKNLRASSAVKEKFSVYSECCVIAGAPNTAEAAFDGLAETAWSEGSKKDAGEYLELELTRPAAGVRILAGYLGARHPVSGDKAGEKQQKLLAGLYRWNSRPKRLELASVDGKHRFVLDLTDSRGQWNVFPILIPAGSYRLTIVSTYKGSRWQDTSIGEIDFMTGELGWLDGLRRDGFFAGFFQDGKPFRQKWIDATPDE